MSNSQPSTSSNANALSDFELELLKQEYFFLQTTIEDYNKQIWAIKALGKLLRLQFAYNKDEYNFGYRLLCRLLAF
ncbi:hypothetical protein [Nostoc sp.]|uniref:hypothetical protein n=1 Tax=Nostoc sp. TaxID=1180 RepID=UPI002FFBCCA1